MVVLDSRVRRGFAIREKVSGNNSQALGFRQQVARNPLQ